MCRKLLAALVLLFSVALTAPAYAQAPAQRAGIDGYRTLAVTAGVLVGVAVVSAVTMGMAGPVMVGVGEMAMAGAPGAVGGAAAGGMMGNIASGAGMAMATWGNTILTAVGGVAGGFTGGWLYGN
ncbi:MAG: hypothetical protein ACT4P2_07630 [Pseudomonadota bacterium]